jgi:rubrerythrin
MKISENDFKKLYYDFSISVNDVAKRLGLNNKTSIYYYKKKFNLISRNEMINNVVTKKYLNNKYIKKSMTILEIAESIGCSTTFISQKLDKFNIKKIDPHLTKTHEQFLLDLKKVHPNKFKVLSKYKGNKEKIKIKCKDCGYIYFGNPNNLLNGHGCPSCYGNVPLTTKKYKDKIYNIVGDEYSVLGEYKGTNSPIKMKHNKCGNVFYVKPNSFINRGSRCRPCSYKIRGKNLRKSHNDFLKKLSDKDITVLENYKTISAPINVICDICGNTWKARPGNLLYANSGCPCCNKSKGENEIRDFLKNNKIKFTTQKSFTGLKGVNDGLLSFDFLVEDITFIEYNGKQHYEPIEFFGGEEQLEVQKEHDKRKKEFCKENEYKLIEIPYWDFENIEDILTEELT